MMTVRSFSNHNKNEAYEVGTLPAPKTFIREPIVSRQEIILLSFVQVVMRVIRYSEFQISTVYETYIWELCTKSSARWYVKKKHAGTE